MENLRAHEVKTGDTLLLGLSQIPAKVLDVENMGPFVVITYQGVDSMPHKLKATRCLNLAIAK